MIPKTLLAAALMTGALLGGATLASARPAGDNQDATVVQRDAAGLATRVAVHGTEYAVCRGEMQDDCINPRQAGLHFGNEPLDHWPGLPASEE
ncbi:MAG TPA: hypothetical protein VF481_12540 [Novosphingobium sp.]